MAKPSVAPPSVLTPDRSMGSGWLHCPVSPPALEMDSEPESECRSGASSFVDRDGDSVQPRLTPWNRSTLDPY